MSGQVAIFEPSDLLGDLTLDGQGATAAAVEVDTVDVEAAVLSASGLAAIEQQAHTTSPALKTSTEPEPDAASAEAVAEQHLTPEQDAAAADCADQFVNSYEQVSVQCRRLTALIGELAA